MTRWHRCRLVRLTSRPLSLSSVAAQLSGGSLGGRGSTQAADLDADAKVLGDLEHVDGVSGTEVELGSYALCFPLGFGQESPAQCPRATSRCAFQRRVHISEQAAQALWDTGASIPYRSRIIPTMCSAASVVRQGSASRWLVTRSIVFSASSPTRAPPPARPDDPRRLTSRPPVRRRCPERTNKRPTFALW